MSDKITYETKEDDIVCHFHARMDTVNCAEIEKELLEHINKSDGKVVFNLASVDYIASSFLRLCVQASQAKGQDKFTITNASPMVTKVFKICGLDRLMS